MLTRVERRVRRLYYDLVLGPRGYGRPISKAAWEAKHTPKYWGFLSSVDEMAHYMVIVGYIHHLQASPRILDVGCGPGRLLELLTPSRFDSFTGIDLSSEAIKQAHGLGIGKARFAVADFEEWEAPGRFDTIVFNESLYYARRPVDTLARYGCALADNGLLLVSMVRYGNHGVIWRQIERRFTAVHATAVETDRGQAWDIKVLRPGGM
jgi:SAM-dependent methyltransferase